MTTFPDSFSSNQEASDFTFRSKEGYSVRIKGRVGLEYFDGTTKFEVDSELNNSPSSIAVFISTAKYSDRKDHVKADMRQQMKVNISQVLSAAGWHVEFFE